MLINIWFFELQNLFTVAQFIRFLFWEEKSKHFLVITLCILQSLHKSKLHMFKMAWQINGVFYSNKYRTYIIYTDRFSCWRLFIRCTNKMLDKFIRNWDTHTEREKERTNEKKSLYTFSIIIIVIILLRMVYLICVFW